MHFEARACQKSVYILIANLIFAAAAPASAETLADAIALAYQTNPTLESARYDLRAADEGLVQARSQLRTKAELNVTGAYNRRINGRVSQEVNPLRPRAIGSNSNIAQVVVSQPLFTGGRATAARDAALANIRVGREILRGTEGDLLLSVITAYVDVRRYRAALLIWQSSVDQLQRLTKEIGARQVAGEVTRTDVAQAEAQLSIARQQMVITEQALEAARADYATLVGHEPGKLSEVPDLPNLPYRVEVAFALAEEQNPEIKHAIFSEHASRASIVAAKAEGQPTLNLRAEAGLIGKALPYHFRNQDQNYTGSVVLTVPLSAGGAIASSIREAEDRNGSDRFKIEATRRDVDRSVSRTWNHMISAAAQVDLQSQQRHFAEVQLDGMVNEYRVGLRSTFDVLFAQQQLRDAEVALLTSKCDHYLAEASLLRQTGLLEARTLLTGVQLRDPESHLREIGGRNSLPWDGVISALDEVTAPRFRQQMLRPSGASDANPSIKQTKGDIIQRTYSRSLPTTPIRESVEQPSAPASDNAHS
ncbi:TolC family outer membrane protein [Altericroceibacterium endophyticum]|uniref:TolC family outer membrane protein n=1 Tax=Altericroceibacterium endophyticum TaxID=1808508 RepID=A0A6I4T824_9SPHN|nr:TolC family outer membrane protein [Altericroceibacterium endophyticum]MXO65955.1 TolC family outer membrane protein [Altericroceibacterium endophyticum]